MVLDGAAPCKARVVLPGLPCGLEMVPKACAAKGERCTGAVGLLEGEPSSGRVMQEGLPRRSRVALEGLPRTLPVRVIQEGESCTVATVALKDLLGKGRVVLEEVWTVALELTNMACQETLLELPLRSVVSVSDAPLSR